MTLALWQAGAGQAHVTTPIHLPHTLVSTAGQCRTTKSPSPAPASLRSVSSWLVACNMCICLLFRRSFVKDCPQKSLCMTFKRDDFKEKRTSSVREVLRKRTGTNNIFDLSAAQVWQNMGLISMESVHILAISLHDMTFTSYAAPHVREKSTSKTNVSSLDFNVTRRSCVGV